VGLPAWQPAAAPRHGGAALRHRPSVVGALRLPSPAAGAGALADHAALRAASAARRIALPRQLALRDPHGDRPDDRSPLVSELRRNERILSASASHYRHCGGDRLGMPVEGDRRSGSALRGACAAAHPSTRQQLRYEQHSASAVGAASGPQRARSRSLWSTSSCAKRSLALRRSGREPSRAVAIPMRAAAGTWKPSCWR
jgi:hypothetical protein